MKIFFAGIFSFYASLAACQSPYEKADSTVYVFLDPGLLNANQTVAVYQELFGEVLKTKSFTNYTVRQRDNIYDLFQQNYNFFDAELAYKVAELNNLKDPNVIITGQILVLPNLPTLPDDQADMGKSQLVDYAVNEIRAIENERIGGDTLRGSSSPTVLEKAGLWTLKFKNKEEALSFIAQTPALKQKPSAFAIAEEEPTFLDYYVPEETSDNSEFLLPIKDSLDLSFIEQRHFRPFYILDEFKKDDCTHGVFVREIAELVLDQYNLSEMKKFIEVFPINFFPNKEEAIEIITEFYSTINEPTAIAKGEKLIAGLKRSTRNCEKCVPEEYVSVLFKHCYSKNRPDIISSSFFVNGFTSDMTPRLANGRVTLFITAGTNEPGKIVEDYFAPDPNRTQVPKVEPIYSYVKAIRDVALVVGSKDHANQLFGMHSQDGSNVTIMGHADGWKSKCIDINCIGNSFATPEVATKLFIARAFWRQHNMTITPLEAKTRAILSSDLEEKFVGKIASAGILNLKKLLWQEKGFISKDGKITPAMITPGKWSFVNDGLGENIYIGRNVSGRGRISGLTIIGDQLYVFQESEMLWKKFSPEVFHLEITIDGVPEIFNSVHEAKSSFDQLVIFKN